MEDWNYTRAQDYLMKHCQGKTQCDTPITPGSFYNTLPGQALNDTEEELVIFFA